MERLTPLLNYLESVNSHGSFTLTGDMDIEKTDLSYLKDRAKKIKITCSAVFKHVSDITDISSSSIVWHTICWSSGLKDSEYIAYSNPSEVNIYLQYTKPQVKVRSDSHQIVNKVEEFCHMLGFYMVSLR